MQKQARFSLECRPFAKIEFSSFSQSRKATYIFAVWIGKERRLL